MANNDSMGESSKQTRISHDNEERPLKKAKYVWQLKGKYHLKHNLANKHHCEPSSEQKEEKIDVSQNDIEKSIYDEIPVTLVKPNNRRQDEYLKRWQARQVSKCLVENIFNSIVENFKSTSTQFDATDFIENCENGEQIEDEGILMAIHHHGLRNYNNVEHFRFHENAREENRENLRVEEERSDDQFDFLSTAVSVAIQKKGLASSYNYG